MKSVSLVSLVFITLGFCVSNVVAQRKPPPAPPAPLSSSNAVEGADDFLGVLEGNNYSNKFFKLKLTVPEEYTVLNRDEIEVYVNAGKDMLQSEKQKQTRAFEEAVNNTVNLLMIAKLPPGSAGNAVLELQVRKQPPGVTADMVLAESAKLITGTGKSEVVEYFKSTKFGGRTFSGVEFETIVMGQKLKQQLYISIVRGYALTLGLTYTNPDSMSAFDVMLESMKFETR